MIHLQALKPFVIYPKNLIDKHIMIIRNLHKNIDIDEIDNVVDNELLDVKTNGNVRFRVCVVKPDNSFPISVYPKDGGVVIRVACINKDLTLIDTVIKNIENTVNFIYKRYPNTIAHEAVHLIDMAKKPHLDKEGYETLRENFIHGIWEEINAFLNEVVYAYPEALNSYDDFVRFMMNKKINYLASDKKATIKLPIFKSVVESIVKQ